MKQLTDMVTDYVRRKRAAGTQWYTWSFRPDRVPPDVLDSRGLAGSWYDWNATLKHRLHDAWVTRPGRRAELERYYIRDWGGVRGNRPETLETYHRAGADENIARGKTGIASWSKALCVRDPLQYAIFDARVSASLNALQIIYQARIDVPIRFPVLASQNRQVMDGNAQLKRHFAIHGWPGEPAGFYRDYLELCRSAGARLGVPGEPLPIYAVEMALFAHTEELLSQAFPGAAPA
jgi:hypothetical protein